MKRLISIVLVLLLWITPSFALTNSDYPIPDTSTGTENHLTASISGTEILLDFDPSDQYSFVSNGYIQSCFYAYNTQKTSYIELYLQLPENVQSGDIITPAFCFQNTCTYCSISVGETGKDFQSIYSAMSDKGNGYPTGVNYTISISSVIKSGDGISISGSFSAVLARYEGTTPTGDLMEINDASFNCTISKGFAVSPNRTPENSGDPNSATPPPNSDFSESVLPTPTPFAVKV